MGMCVNMSMRKQQELSVYYNDVVLLGNMPFEDL